MTVTGARPNFMKAAPLYWAAEQAGVDLQLIHTGQHYDPGMSQVFFDELDLPKPHRHLEVGSGTHAQVTSRCLERLETVFMEERPDWVLVVGDVNSTVAGALAAVKLGIPTAHIEAGLRSFDRQMPEEINRIVTDAVSDVLFVTEPSGVTNLVNEGRSKEIIHLVGNVMIDTMFRYLHLARARKMQKQLDLPQKYAVLTLHRPSNVDREKDLDELISHLAWAQERLPIVFPIHPRTRAVLNQHNRVGNLEKLPNFYITGPMGYLDFLSLMLDSRVVLTDSGGIQEETTALGIPCITLRDNTERPITCEQGGNKLAGARGTKLADALNPILMGKAPKTDRPELWDGRAAERIIQILLQSRS